MFPKPFSLYDLPKTFQFSEVPLFWFSGQRTETFTFIYWTFTESISLPGEASWEEMNNVFTPLSKGPQTSGEEKNASVRVLGSFQPFWLQPLPLQNLIAC